MKQILYTLSGVVAYAMASSEDPIWRTDFTHEEVSFEDNLYMYGADFCAGNGDLIYVYSFDKRSSTEDHVSILYPQRSATAIIEDPVFNTDDNIVTWDVVRLFNPAEAPENGFGWDISCVGDHVTGRTLFVSSHYYNIEYVDYDDNFIDDRDHDDHDDWDDDDDYQTYYEPNVFVYKGSWTHWTNTQMLHSSDESPNNYGFGISIDADKFTQRTLVVGCDSCANEDGDEYNGKLYVYEATSPSASMWTETQILELTETYSPSNGRTSYSVNCFGTPVNGNVNGYCDELLYLCPGDVVQFSLSGNDWTSWDTSVFSREGDDYFPNYSGWNVPNYIQCDYFNYSYSFVGADTVDFGFHVIRNNYHSGWSLGTSVNVYNDVIVAGGFSNYYTPAYFVYFRRPDGQWSFQQTIEWNSLGSETHSNYKREQISLFNDVLVIGTPFEHVSGYTVDLGSAPFDGSYAGADDWAGKVSILMSSRDFSVRATDVAGKPKPAPNTLHWSHQQVLVSQNPVSWGYFGAATAIDAGTLFVSEPNGFLPEFSNDDYVYRNSLLWVYTRKSGSWTATQFFRTDSVSGISQSNYIGYNFNYYNVYSGLYTYSSEYDDFSTPFIRPQISVYGESAAMFVQYDQDLAGVTVFNSTSKWDCLIINVADHFGDGWDTAVLEVTTPDGRMDKFSPPCSWLTYYDDDNEHFSYIQSTQEFLYCPTNVEDAGVYTFTIPGWQAAKFWWEIEWTVKSESQTALPYNAVGVEYRGKHDSTMKFMWESDNQRFVPLLPEMKNLIQNQTKCDPCLQVPPPHYGEVYSDDARWFMIGGTSAWYNKFSQASTRYYISDREGHRLIQTAQFCPASVDADSVTRCFMDIPDGDYLFRVGGGLNPVAYGNMAFLSNAEDEGDLIIARAEQLFSLDHGVIQTSAVMEFYEICSDYPVVVHGLGVVKLNGLAVSSFADLSTADVEGLKFMIASMFDADEVTILKVEDSVVTFKVTAPLGETVSAENEDAMNSALASFGADFLSANSYSFVSALGAHTTELLNTITSVDVVSFQATTVSREQTTTGFVVKDASFQQSMLASSKTFTQSNLYSVATVSEIFLGLALCGLVLFVVTRVYRAKKAEVSQVEIASV